MSLPHHISRRALIAGALSLATAVPAEAGWWPRGKLAVTSGSTTPTLVPGTGYTPTQRSEQSLATSQGTPIPGRPEMVSWALPQINTWSSTTAGSTSTEFTLPDVSPTVASPVYTVGVTFGSATGTVTATMSTDGGATFSPVSTVNGTSNGLTAGGNISFNRTAGAIYRVERTGGSGTISTTAFTLHPRFVGPILQWVTPSVTDQVAFGSTYKVQVVAFCADTPGILNGVSGVDIGCNGAVATITKQMAIKVQLSAAQGGGFRYEPGYEVNVDLTAVPDGTPLEFWTTARTNTPGMQTRMIGPNIVIRKTAYDRTITIDPQGTVQSNLDAANPQFQALNAAWAAIVARTDLNSSTIQIKFASNVTDIDVSTFAGQSSWIAATINRTARVYVEGNTGSGGKIRVYNPNSTSAATYYKGMTPYFSGLVFSNFLFDVSYIASFMTCSGERVYTLLRNCEISSAGVSTSARLRPGMYETNPYTYLNRDGLWQNTLGGQLAMEQCYLHDFDAAGGVTSALIKIGCKQYRHNGDATNFSYNRPLTVIGCDFEQVDGSTQGAPNPAIAITGPANAYYTITGTWATTGRTLTLYNADGTVAGTFTGASYNVMDDVIPAINALSGWTATRINQTTTCTFPFSYLAPPTSYKIGAQELQVYPGASSPNYSGTVPISDYLCFGKSAHVDFMQFVGTLSTDNILFLASNGIQNVSQLIYITSGAPASISNSAVLLCGIADSLDGAGATTLKGQVNGNLYHLLIGACTQPSGELDIGTTSSFIDASSRFENIYANDIGLGGATSTSCAGKIRQIIAGRQSTAAASNSNITDITSLGVSSGSPPSMVFNTADFPNLSKGAAVGNGAAVFALADFIPAAGGKLRLPANLKQPSVYYDQWGSAFNPAGDMVGCAALATVAA